MTESSSQQELSGPTDEDLWAEFVRGRDAALDVLVQRYRTELNWYLVLSTGKQDAAARFLRNVWAQLAAYRRPFEGFESFRSWLYAATTQNSVPATHPEMFGLTDLLDDIKRAEQASRRGKLFFHIRDMAQAVRQPFLLVTVVGLSVTEAAKACNFSVERTWKCLGKAYRRLARTDLFRRRGGAGEV